MALGPRLDLRQSQSLVMTPQLQQAIRLLALSNLELETFIGEALEANPLLEMGEVSRDETPGGEGEALVHEAGADSPDGEAALDLDASALDHDRDTGDGDWSAAQTGGGAEGPDISERGGDGPSLAEHLHAQVGAAAGDSREEFVARALVDQ